MQHRLCHGWPLRQNLDVKLCVETSERPRPDEYCIEHRLGQLAGEGVLLAGVVRPDQRHASELSLSPVTEGGTWARNLLSSATERAKRGCPRETSQRNEHSRLREA